MQFERGVSDFKLFSFWSWNADVQHRDKIGSNLTKNILDNIISNHI